MAGGLITIDPPSFRNLSIYQIGTAPVTEPWHPMLWVVRPLLDPKATSANLGSLALPSNFSREHAIRMGSRATDLLKT
jgi:hypothetical protein